MRIIAGNLGGRIFQSPNGQRTHPMSDKMRGALFNMLGDIDDLSVLDAFAGSGALAFEAVSRGAKQAVAIEQDRRAQQAIKESIASLDLNDYVQLVRANAKAWLTTSDQTFDVILLDPPYDNVQLPLLLQLSERLVKDGLLVLSWPGKTEPPELSGLRLKSSKSYGDGNLHVYANAQ